jgi:hypothetical protein
MPFNLLFLFLGLGATLFSDGGLGAATSEFLETLDFSNCGGTRQCLLIGFYDLCGHPATRQPAPAPRICLSHWLFHG